jgi:hypothetical protein
MQTTWKQNGTIHYFSTGTGIVFGCTLLCSDGWMVWVNGNRNPVGTYDSLEAAKNRIELESVDDGLNLLVGT